MMPARGTILPLVRILIADDHAIFRDGLRRLLEGEKDFQVVGEAADGAEAVRLAGLEVLREFASLQKPRIVLLTAAIERSEIVQALQLGARGIVLKAWASDVLLKGIRGVMAGEYWVGRESVSDLVEALRSVEPASATPEQRQRKFGLTPRELEVVGTVVAGYTNKEIAQALVLSEDTVKHHLTSVFNKTGASNRLELALFAIHHNLLPDLPAPRLRPS